MLKWNLTADQQALLRWMVETAKAENSTRFQHNRIDEDEAGGSILIGTQRRSAGYEDIMEFSEGDFVRLSSVAFAECHGALTQRAFDVVASDFAPPAPPAPTIAQTFNVGRDWRGNVQAVGVGSASMTSSGKADIDQLRELTRELVESLRAALPPGEATEAERDAEAAVDELTKDEPNPEVVARKTRSLLGRVNEGLRTGAELAERGGKVALAMGKLGAWTYAAWRLLAG